MIETGKMRVARRNIGGVSKGTIIYKDNIIKRHKKNKKRRKRKELPSSDSKALSIIIPEVVGKMMGKQLDATSVCAPNAFTNESKIVKITPKPS